MQAEGHGGNQFDQVGLFLETNFSIKNRPNFGDFSATYLNISFRVNAANTATIWTSLLIIGLLFIPTSGHAGLLNDTQKLIESDLEEIFLPLSREREREREREVTSLNQFNFLSAMSDLPSV